MAILAGTTEDHPAPAVATRLAFFFPRRSSAPIWRPGRSASASLQNGVPGSTLSGFGAFLFQPLQSPLKSMPDAFGSHRNQTGHRARFWWHIKVIQRFCPLFKPDNINRGSPERSEKRRLPRRSTAKAGLKQASLRASTRQAVFIGFLQGCSLPCLKAGMKSTNIQTCPISQITRVMMEWARLLVLMALPPNQRLTGCA